MVHYSTERSMAATDPQFQWLNATLRAVDRPRTPWRIVQVCLWGGTDSIV